MSAAAETTIYEAIGGQDALIAVVDDFYERVLADPELAPYFAGARMPALKGKQVEFFAAALGGPDVYQGQSMKDAHAGRGITRGAFDKVAYHLTNSLVGAGVPGDLVAQIIGAVAPLAGDIVARDVQN
ncbi:MAG TPA: group 1 truncated hemoglobin [Trebonia sp.]|jgi:hemoglobin